MLTAGVVTLSPVALVLSGTFLPYSFQLLFAFLVLPGVRLESRPRLVMAGVALGVAFFARPFDALLVAAPFALVVTAGIRRRGCDIDHQAGGAAG